MRPRAAAATATPTLCVRLLIKAFSHETRRVEEKFPFLEKKLSVAIPSATGSA
jgi:hypothetical protein